MTMAAPQVLANRLAELLMSQLLPCDLGDGIEVVHDVEAIEVEMDCDLADPSEQFARVEPAEPTEPLAAPEPDPGDTVVMLKTWFDEIEVGEDAGTHQFIKLSAPYERIEIEIDANAYRRATIADARKLTRARHALERHRFATALDPEL
jgi:hypothetical protein